MHLPAVACAVSVRDLENFLGLRSGLQLLSQAAPKISHLPRFRVSFFCRGASFLLLERIPARAAKKFSSRQSHFLASTSALQLALLPFSFFFSFAFFLGYAAAKS